jgi:hypothetical protein
MVRRAVSATLFLLMLHATVLSSGLLTPGGSACDRKSEQRDDLRATPEMTAMPGMDMSTAPHNGNEHRGPLKGGCNLPWAFGCTSAAACGPAATIAGSTRTMWVDYAVGHVASRAMTLPRSPDFAPDFPPPRI